MKTYTERIFEELVQNDNSTEAKLRRYLERKRMKQEEFERNRLHPKTRKELQDMIIDAIKKNGPEVDLNYIDVSGVDDMHLLFCMYYGNDEDKNKILQSFNGDISEWDVSSVEDMMQMFSGAKSFNGDISDWDVGSVENMSYMFNYAENFNRDISGWDVRSVANMRFMFSDAKNFNKNISGWDVSSVMNMQGMFSGATSFNQNLSGWDVVGKDTEDMFRNCPIDYKNEPKGLE